MSGRGISEQETIAASRITRRYLLGSAAAMGIAALLAACGGDDDDENTVAATDEATTAVQDATATSEPEPTHESTESSTDTETEEASETAESNASDETSTAAETDSATESAADANQGSAGSFPRTVVHFMGETEIEAQPQRVVAVSDWFELDNLLAMGVRPVLYGYTNRYGTGVTPWAQEAGEEGLETYEEVDEVDFELIVGAQPDLIICEWYRGQQVYEQLAAIAPTVVLPKPDTDETGWRLPQRVAGEACGTEEAAESAITDTEAVLSEQKERLAEVADRKVTIAYGLYDGSWFADSSDGPSGRLMNDLGIQLQPVGADDNKPISSEQLNLLSDTDILLSYDTGAEPMDEWESNPLVRQVQSTQDGRYAVLAPEVLRAIFSPTTLSVRWGASAIADAILQAAAGEGKRLVD